MVGYRWAEYLASMGSQAMVCDKLIWFWVIYLDMFDGAAEAEYSMDWEPLLSVVGNTSGVIRPRQSIKSRGEARRLHWLRPECSSRHAQSVCNGGLDGYWSSVLTRKLSIC